MKTSQKVFLITGGLGLLGSHLVPALLKKVSNCRIIVVDRVKRKTSWKDNSKAQLIFGDLREDKIWTKIPKDITHVFHLAAIIPWEERGKERADIAMDNLLPLVHLIEHSKKWPGLKQVIYSSSISVYGQTGRVVKEGSPERPGDIYAVSKLRGEQLLVSLKTRGIKVASLRYSSLYGHRQYPNTVLPLMINRAMRKKEILVYGNGKRTQDFLHCDDAANANIAAYKKQADDIFNIGSGMSVSMTELAKTVSKIFTNNAARITHLPERAETDAGYRVDISKAEKELDYKSLVQLDSGLYRLKKDMQKTKKV